MSQLAILFSLVLAPAAVVPSRQVSPAVADTNEQTTVVRACVEKGTHGSVANLKQVEVVTAGRDVSEPRRLIYWFDKNLVDFPSQTGRVVEITATITEILEGNAELRAPDGVFGEARVGAAVKATAVGTAGSAAAQPAGTPGAAATDVEDLPTTVIKAAVTRLRTVGSCR